MIKENKIVYIQIRSTQINGRMKEISYVLIIPLARSFTVTSVRNMNSEFLPWIIWNSLTYPHIYSGCLPDDLA